MGVELDRKWARDEKSGRQAEERRHCCSHAKTWRRKCVGGGAAQLERRDLRQVKEGGRSKGFWRAAEGGDCVILSLVCPWTLADLQVVWLGILLQKLRKMEKSCLTKMFSKLTQQDFFCDLERERERTKEDTTLEAVDMATFLNSKLELRHCIWSHISIQERRVWKHCLAIQVNSKLLVVLCLKELKWNLKNTYPLTTRFSFSALSWKVF